MAEVLAEAGAAVALVARDPAGLTGACAAITAKGGRAVAIAGSVEDRAFCTAAVAKTEAALGPLSVLVNAAGIQGPIGLLDTLDPPAIEHTMRVNFFGTVWMMQAALPGMAARRAGAVINVSGGGATSPRERFAAYAASKIAVVRVSEIAALEYAHRGIRVNAVSPGAVNTRMTDEIEAAAELAGSAAQREAREQRESGGVDPRTPASLIAWLASDAAAHLNGRLVSAVRDDWRELIANGRAPEPDAMTLRRR